MKLIIVGGHLSPALAVIDELPKDTNVLFIGRKYVFEGDRAFSLEYKTIVGQKIPFAEISTGRLQRKFTRFTIPSLFKLPIGIVQSFFILKKFKPDVVLSFGGYLSVPVGITAFLLSIPLVIHEQTLERGFANKILSIFAKKICISWESSFKYFPRSKTVLTGNPVRKFKVQSPIKSGTKFKVNRDGNTLPTIYITGGSSGSHFINKLVEGCIEELLKKFIVIHQTGDAQEYHDFDRLQKIREGLHSELKARYTIIKFVEPNNIGSIMKKVHLVVSRAGINTITELIYFNKPSLLIPISFSQRNEQVKNALFLKNLGLADVFNQNSLDSKKLLLSIGEMINNKSRYQLTERFWTSQNDNGEAAKKIIEVTKKCKEDQ